jgi:hypothetical protein
MFDDNRLHLTEKTLRPIACGQPFILSGTHGSLAYLREYGFKTFDTIWDEKYDSIIDAEERLQAIVTVMKQIADWDPCTRQQKIAQANEIAVYNKQWFFSQEFFNLVTNELETNLQNAFEELESCNNYQPWIDHWTRLLQNPEVVDFLNSTNTTIQRNQIDQIMKIALEKLNKT